MNKLNKEKLKIVSCRKHFIILENDHIPSEILDQEADGNVLLEFSDQSLLLFYGVTETSSLKIDRDLALYDYDRSKFTDISTNDFWKKRIGVEIADVKLLYNGNFICTVQFFFVNNENFEISYLYETEYDFDTTVVRSI